MALNLYNGREPEVIVNYNDGFAYSKGKMEEAFRPGGLFDTLKPVKTIKEAISGKKEDIDIIVHEFEIPRSQAERVLTENGGDVEKALKSLIS